MAIGLPGYRYGKGRRNMVIPESREASTQIVVGL